MKYQRLENESDEALIFRVAKDKELIGTWQDVADILNPLLGTDYGESTFRKKYTAFTQMFEANRNIFTSTSSEINELNEARRALEIEKWKFRDERNEWNRQNRIHARAEEKLDGLEEVLKDIGCVVFPSHIIPSSVRSGKSMLILLSDFHIGAEYSNYFGEYDTHIAKDRVGQLLESVKKVADTHKVKDCYVCLLGDMISGSIHHSVQVTNRENVIEQIKSAAEIVGSFCYELTKMFSMVTMISVDGNHSRFDDKDRAIHDERADQLIPFCTNMLLSHINNFYYCEEANIDSGIAMFMINDKTYIAVHGDYDAFTDSGVKNLISVVQTIPYAVLFGHKHFPATSECSGVKMVQNGSLCGSGDQFTVERRLGGKANQTICVCDDKGIEAYYPVELE